MRNLIFLIAIVCLAACNNDKVESMHSDESTKADSLNYPYTADYSHNFEIGSSKNAMTLLQLYKDWDNNTLENSKNSFAENNDTLYFSDGNMFAGNRDSLIKVATQARTQMGTVVDSVHAWVPLKSKDKNEEWVAIWTREISTDSTGKRSATELHEIWRFDKDGKINLVYQFAIAPPKMPPPPMPKKK
jgi:hypothetical protein